MRKKWFYRIPAMIVIAIAAVAVFGWVVERLWNWLVPSIIGWHAINFWQAVGILVLSKILFGGFRGRGGMHWRHRMGERFEKMSPEEREKFREGMRNRCGEWGRRGRRDWQAGEQKV